MPRTPNYMERVSEAFNHLDSMSQADVVAELFTRLADRAKQEAYRRMTNHAKMKGLTAPGGRKPAQPSLLTEAESAAVGPGGKR